MKSNCKDDQATSKKALANLVTTSSITSDRDCCGMDVCAEESNSRIVTASLKDFSFSSQIDRLIKI